MHYKSNVGGDISDKMGVSKSLRLFFGPAHLNFPRKPLKIHEKNLIEPIADDILEEQNLSAVVQASNQTL